MTKSSNHTLSLHRPTSNSSSNSNFAWVSPTDKWTQLLFPYSLISSRHGPRTENTALLLFRACLLGFPSDRYPSCPLARSYCCKRLFPALPRYRSIRHNMFTFPIKGMRRLCAEFSGSEAVTLCSLWYKYSVLFNVFITIQMPCDEIRFTTYHHSEIFRAVSMFLYHEKFQEFPRNYRQSLLQNPKQILLWYCPHIRSADKR
jgi:hypothetical protein